MTERFWERYVAIGDSFTEGLMDASPTEPDRFVGWADRLAARLSAHNASAGVEFGYANLAVRGRLIADVVGPQLDAALELTPDLVSLSAGGNDCLRPKVDIDAVVDELEEAVIRIRATGADVLLATSPNVRESPIVNRVNPRVAEFSADIWGVATRNDCFVLDLWNLKAVRHRDMWADDRIHFSSAGHERVAREATRSLGIPIDGALPDVPDAAPLTRWESIAANREWVRTHLRPWIGRRLRGRSSGDDVSPKRPELAPVTPLGL